MSLLSERTSGAPPVLFSSYLTWQLEYLIQNQIESPITHLLFENFEFTKILKGREVKSNDDKNIVLRTVLKSCHKSLKWQERGNSRGTLLIQAACLLLLPCRPKGADGSGRNTQSNLLPDPTSYCCVIQILTPRFGICCMLSVRIARQGNKKYVGWNREEFGIKFVILLRYNWIYMVVP